MMEKHKEQERIANLPANRYREGHYWIQEKGNEGNNPWHMVYIRGNETFWIGTDGITETNRMTNHNLVPIRPPQGMGELTI